MVGCDSAVMLGGFAELRLGGRGGRWRVGGRRAFYDEGCYSLVVEVAVDLLDHVGVSARGSRVVYGSRGIGVCGVVLAVVGRWVVHVLYGA